MGASATEPLWRPSRERIRRRGPDAVHGRGRSANGVSPPAATATSMAGRSRSPSSSGSRCGRSAASSPTRRGSGAEQSKRMPGAQFFPGPGSTMPKTCCAARDETEALVFWGEDKVKRRLTWRPALRPGLAAGAGPDGHGHPARRPRRRLCAEHAGDRGRHAGHRQHRRHLVVLLAGFRRPRRHRPLRPDRPARAVHAPTATTTTARRTIPWPASPSSCRS